jgi:hypothetical protein
MSGLSGMRYWWLWWWWWWWLQQLQQAQWHAASESGVLGQRLNRCGLHPEHHYPWH